MDDAARRSIERDLSRGRRLLLSRITMVWAVIYAGFALTCALTRTPMLLHRYDPGPAAGWVVAIVAGSAALAVGAATRYGLRSGLRRLIRVLSVLVAVGAFGLLMDLLSLLFLAPVGSWVVRTNHLLAGIGTVLLAVTASRPRRTSTTTRTPSAAPRAVQAFAILGTLAFVPYVTMKTIWAVGGTFAGVTGAEVLARSAQNGASDLWLALEAAGLDPTVLLAALGVFLMWGLVRPWGHQLPGWVPVVGGHPVPRWLPLAPAIIGAATLVAYGVIGIGYLSLATAGVVPITSGDLPSRESTLIVAWNGMIAFAGFGVGIAVAAASYWRRTRPGVSRRRPQAQPA